MMSGFAWLPDSTGIVYSSSRDDTMPYLPMLGMWQVRLRDGSVRRVISGETSYMSPDISKSGAIVVSRMTLHADIWKFPVDGRPAENMRRGIRVTRQTGQVLTPTASPDNREVAFLSDSGGHANLWVVNTEKGELRQVTHERDQNVAVGVPLWSPNGHTIAFVYSRGEPGINVWSLAGGFGWEQPAQCRQSRSGPRLVARWSLGVLLDVERPGSHRCCFEKSAC